ncbi:uncharacterized protein TRAVEDRAFT_51023 [Trametes versicolor FP-101664 SS1]|uniref:uncharacterized protein n=1 Tax=Trametes versicolor (strain FP-101664) TaxID=717944 RepID=UPI0004624987|nr:uncharacterized protein TRAVEDRAFT_51023 [Trametes versicolor FP-101664 SS1]EIW54887.1 hypothetical protein TRAVEDRAFT_51023 [Trametes versicolor FP-101664 SS1]
MPLSWESRMALLSIFKSTKNARHTFDWKVFNNAMEERGFELAQAGVVVTYFVPPFGGGGAFVLHMDHRHTMSRSQQDYVKRRLSHAFGWHERTFVNNF